MMFVRSFLFNTGLVTTTVVFSLLSLLVAPFPFSVRSPFIVKWCNVNLWWLKVTCGITHELEGTENLPADPAVILSKHQSTWETLAFATIFAPQAYVLKRELLWLPFFGWGVALMEPIAIDRSSGRKAVQQIIDTGSQRLKNKRWVIVFPEGTRIAPGRKGRYGAGGSVLAVKTGYPVVPIAHNAGELWPRRSFMKKPGVIRVVIGPAIDTHGRTVEEVKALAEQWIETKMQEITDPQYLPALREEGQV